MLNPIRATSRRPLQVGFKKETKPGECRFLGIPSSVELLLKKGIGVLVEKDAGQSIGIGNGTFRDLGATVVPDAQDIFHRAQIIIMTKELQSPDYGFINESHILYNYSHVCNPAAGALLEVLLKSRATTIAFETMRDKNGFTFALHPMSLVAGRFAVDMIARELNYNDSGIGVQLGGFPGLAEARPARVFILGGGTVGTAAAEKLLLNGASVAIAEINPTRIAFLSDYLGGLFKALKGSSFSGLGYHHSLKIIPPPAGGKEIPQQTIIKFCTEADAVIGGPNIPTADTPKLITREMLVEIARRRKKAGRPPLVIVDPSADNGGCVYVGEIQTTHNEPWARDKFGNRICNTQNMPGGYNETSSSALAQAIMPPVVDLAILPFNEALMRHPELIWGINTLAGKVTVEKTADVHHQPYTPIFDALVAAETGFGPGEFKRKDSLQYQFISTGENQNRNLTPDNLGRPVRCSLNSRTCLEF